LSFDVRMLEVAALVACSALALVMAWRMHRRTRRLASLDPLTGALTRQAFIESFVRDAARALHRPRSRFALLLLDVDHFHRVNEAWGQRAGDRSLASVVAVARQAIREEDLIGRLEGDVFAILMRTSSSDTAAARAEHLQREIHRQACARAGLKNPVTVSVGVAMYGAHGRRWEEVLRAAEAAVSRAKSEGGDRVVAAAPVLRPAVLEVPPATRPIAVPRLRQAV
jgi:diguanylate cyclase (GGDEF)-like protein